MTTDNERRVWRGPLLAGRSFKDGVEIAGSIKRTPPTVRFTVFLNDISRPKDS